MTMSHSNDVHNKFVVIPYQVNACWFPQGQCPWSCVLQTQPYIIRGEQELLQHFEQSIYDH